ncbi:hypothetical protein JCM9279_000149 [Rhodotorula babjevae]
MFSGGAAGTPSAAQRTTRRSTRAARAAAALSGGSTPLVASPPPPGLAQQQQRTLGANLAVASKALSSATPSRRTRSVAAGSDAGSSASMLMDLDEAGQAQQHQHQHQQGKDADRLLVKDESYAITERKGLPVEVQEAIAASDPYTLPVKAVLDPITGFALLVSSDRCFVWNWASRTSSTTTYIFPLPAQAPFPPGVTAYSPLSFASLVPSASQTAQREPGLVAVSNTGTVRFWDSISLSLAGADRFKSVSLALAEGELVRHVALVSPTTYLAATSQSRVFALSIVSQGGRATLAARPLERAVGWAGSVWSAVFGTKAVDPRAGILALAVAQPVSAGATGAAAGGGDGVRRVYAVQEKSAQVWDVPLRGEGGERLVAEHDVFHAVLEAIAGEKVGNEQWAMNEGRVEVVDAAVTATGHLALLVSHVHNATADEYRSFAIVQLDIQHDAVTPIGLTLLAYQSRPDPRPLSTARLSIGAGEVAFVTFPDAVVIASIASDSSFEEAFPLRQNSTRFLGLSMPSYLLAPPSPTETLSLLTSTPSLVTVTVTAPHGSQQRVAPGGVDALKTQRLKTRLEQAIFYGTREAENPLAFDIQPDFEGDLAKASTAVSANILASSSSNMPLILDLRAQLADRVHRTKALIEYINANGILSKLPQSARKQLSWDAERLQAAVALWAHVNARIGASGHSILADAILTFMDEVGEGFGEDPLRLFFRTKVGAVGKVLEEVAKQAKGGVDSSVGAEEKSEKLFEANQVILAAFKAVSRHRADTAQHYGLTSSAEPTEPWSSRPVLLEALQWHFDATDALLRERVRELGSQQRKGVAKGEPDELRNQMAGVAEFTFSAFEERLRHLKTINGDAATPESRLVAERYYSLRPRFINTLVAVGKVGAAFELGERHGDYKSLVRLSNDAAHGSPARISAYLDRYGKDFAFPLYSFYLEHGKLRTLLEPEEAHRDLLTEFLDSTDNDGLAWINDIAIGRLEHATDVLFTVAEKEQNVAQKKIMLSLSKLAQVAQVDTQSIEEVHVQQTLETLDDNLDLVNTQDGLLALFESLLSGQETRLSAAEQGEVIAARVAPGLEDRPALAQHLATLAGKLFEEQALSAEDLIDLLTLKENVGEQAGDFAAALDVLVRAKNLPAERRQVALESIWRRVFIQDDWASLKSAVGVSDEEMANALRHTAYYATLAAASRSEHQPSDLPQPAQAFSTATPTSLSARSPDLPSPSVTLLLNDIEQESRLLSECVQNGLEQFAREIVRLLEEGTPAVEEEELGGEAVMVE